MKVYVWPEKTYEDLGTKRWEVEWFTVRPSALKRIQAAEDRGDEDEVDPDRDIVSHQRTFPYRAKGLAIALAKRMATCDASAYGSATVTLQVVDWYVEDDRIAEWTNAGDPEYVD